MIYLCNGFSVHMLERLNCGEAHRLRIERISATEAGRILRSNAFRSYFGHSDTAVWLENYLRVHIPACRGTIEFTKKDILILATIDSKRKWEQGIKPGPGFKFYLVEYEA